MTQGRCPCAEQALTFDLQKLSVYPQPLPEIHDRSFMPPARAAFTKAMDDLEASLPRLNEQEIIVTLAEAVALSGNAHTRLYLLPNRTELRRLPVRVHGDIL